LSLHSSCVPTSHQHMVLSLSMRVPGGL